MATLLKMKWVEKSPKPEPHQRIQHIGGVSREFHWKHSQMEAIEFIEGNVFDYYVENGLRVTRLNIMTTNDGNKYLAAETGGELLLNLPAFPQSKPETV